MKIDDDGEATKEEHYGPCLRSTRSYIAERALRWLGHVARMPSDKLPRRMLTAWVYQAKGSSARKLVKKQTTSYVLRTRAAGPGRNPGRAAGNCAPRGPPLAHTEQGNQRPCMRGGFSPPPLLCVRDGTD